jgi:Rrf2 family protein
VTVDLTLSKRGDYVVRAAIALASAWDGGGTYRKIRQVAEEMGLPLSYTPQLLGILARAGLAEAKAGRTGGYRLSRPPGDISVLEVVEAAEGDLASRRCAIRGGPCRWDDVCALHPTVVRAAEAIRSTLAATSLAEVADVDRGLAAADRQPAHGRRSRGATPAR